MSHHMDMASKLFRHMDAVWLAATGVAVATPATPALHHDGARSAQALLNYTRLGTPRST